MITILPFWVNQLVAQIWPNLLMDDYHFASWVNQLAAQIWLNLLMDDYHFGYIK
jgi:hypothetical protein